MQRYYIAYGSNLSTEEMKVRCPDAIPVGTTTLKDWRLVFRLHATIETKEGCEVPAVVWAISAADESSLDHYEGFPRYYYKTKLPITMRAFDTNRNRKIEAMVYIMRDVREITPPTPDYRMVIEDGYVRFGLDMRVLQRAFDDSIYEYTMRMEERGLV